MAILPQTRHSIQDRFKIEIEALVEAGQAVVAMMGCSGMVALEPAFIRSLSTTISPHEIAIRANFLFRTRNLNNIGDPAGEIQHVLDGMSTTDDHDQGPE